MQFKGEYTMGNKYDNTYYFDCDTIFKILNNGENTDNRAKIISLKNFRKLLFNCHQRKEEITVNDLYYALCASVQEEKTRTK